MDNPLFIQLLHNLSDKVDSHNEESKQSFMRIQDELKEIKDSQNKDLGQLKVDQAQCKAHWNTLGKVASFGGIGTVLATILAKLFGLHL